MAREKSVLLWWSADDGALERLRPQHMRLEYHPHTRWHVFLVRRAEAMAASADLGRGGIHFCGVDVDCAGDDGILGPRNYSSAVTD